MHVRAHSRATGRGAKMLRAKNIDITGGPILKSIVLFAIPVMIGSLIQVLFNAADLMIVGQMSSQEVKDIATASIGATSNIVNLLVNSFVGLASGVGVILARALGQNDGTRVKKITSTALITSVVIGILAMTACIVFSGPFLIMTNCPDECLSHSTLYLDIYAIGIPFIMFYNFGSAIIRTTGDTQRPLYYIIIAGILNVALNFLLCLVLEQKVAAVAIATTVSQIVSAICVLIHLLKIDGPCKMNIREIKFSFSELLKIFRIGLPSAINSSLFSIANLQIQAEVNAYGSACMAGVAAASSLESFGVAISNGFNSAVVPFVGQNVGAEKPERVKRSIICCMILAGTSNLLICTAIYLLRQFLLALYLPQGGMAVAFASRKMIFVLLPYFIAFLYSTLSASMQAFGYSFVPMINSILCVLGLRVAWMSFIYPALLGTAERSLDTIHNLYLCFPVSWVLCLIAHSIAFSIIYSRYKKGKISII